MLPDTPSSLSLSPRHSHWARGSASGGGVCAPPPASESSSEESCTGNWPCPCPRPRPRPRRLAALSLQIIGTAGCGGSCRCKPLVARDSLGLVVRSSSRRRDELPVAVGVSRAELVLHLAWLTSDMRSFQRVGATELCPGSAEGQSGHRPRVAHGPVLGGINT